MASKGHIHYPDYVDYDYLSVVKNQLPFANGLSEKVTSKKITIVGAGPAGMITAYELASCGFTNIEVIDAGDQFGSSTIGEAAYPPGATLVPPGGRVLSYISQRFGTIYELGAMRFPANSKLFWNYYMKALPDYADRGLNPFPNPGVVPTHLFYKGQSYFFQTNVKDLPEEFTVLKKKFAAIFENAVPNFSFGDIATLLKKETLSSQDKDKIKQYWKSAINLYVDKSFYEVIRQKNTLTNEEVDKLYTIGLGTGPFGSLFPISFLDFMRLLLWDYGDEYGVTYEQVANDFVYGFYEQIKQRFGNAVTFRPNVYVLGVYRGLEDTVYQTNVDGDTLNHTDICILATSHRSMSSILNLNARGYIDSSDRPQDNKLYAIGAFDPYLVYDKINQKGIDKLNKLLTSIGQVNQVDSCKAFLSISKADLEKIHFPKVNGSPVRVILTDTMAQQLYVIPNYNSDGSEKDNYSVLISYTWGAEAAKLQGTQNINIQPDWKMPYDIDQQDDMVAMLIRNFRDLTIRQEDLPQGGDARYISDFFQKMMNNKSGKSHVWNNSPTALGAFKLNLPGQYDEVSTMAYQHQMTADEDIPREYTYIFTSGESSSFYGGWIEGAAIGAINATSGTLYRLAKNNNELDKLRPDIRNLVETKPYGRY